MVHVYYHIYAIDGVESIVEEQISLLKKHFDFPYILNIGISLAEENKSIYHLLTKFKNVRDVRARGNEFVTLELIQKDVETNLLQILNNIDWQRFHNLCLSIGRDLNEPQWRFLKAIFLENAIANYSNNELTYVGDSEQGCDFIVKKLNNLRIEMKYVEGCIFSGKKLCQKKNYFRN